ncbi:MAG: 3-deoxy-D-manno-octulosonic acid transferase [Desulfobulbaceae bacterium]|nr:3-deoxy-D-manno-octulosonic acid transferase [Desulfobulbaceae bacterium]
MLLIYNLLQIILGIFLLPILLVFVLLTPKYRKATWLRLGFGLHDLVRNLGVGRPRIWIHALSVGEVSSARALVRRLKQEYPDGLLIFSASTTSGRRYAASVLAGQVDLLVPFPLDFFWSVERFVRALQPEVFVLVETDLWPNFLASLDRHGVPALLVNGRISAESFQKYWRFRFFFAPLFRSFKYIAMQTIADAGKMKQLGVSADRLLSLGNLKYGVLDESCQTNLRGPKLKVAGLTDKRFWVAGSTHPGEEEIILKVYQQLRLAFNDLYLIIAPRNVERGTEIAVMASGFGFESVRRSEGSDLTGDLLILDTLGELASVYQLADFAFIGGSLVMERGHNPLEPAAFARPVIFGPYMEDFEEIAGDLLAVGGAVRVDGEKAMILTLEKWLGDDKIRQAAGQCAASLVEEQRGVTARHVDLLRQVINERQD